MSKTKMFHKFISLALCLCMTLTLLPITARAAAGTVANWGELAAAYDVDGNKIITIPTGTTVTVTGDLGVPQDGKMYTITGGGTLKLGRQPGPHSFFNGKTAMFYVGENAQLTLANITLNGNNYQLGCIVDVYDGIDPGFDGGKLTMTGGKITGGNCTSGAVYVGGNCTFTMSDGSITGNKGADMGMDMGMGIGIGGVYVDGTFTMTGGSITGNNIGLLANGMSTMSGGSITGNNIGVVVIGRFIISGGARITGNTYNGAASNVIVVENPILIAGKLTGAVGITAESTVSPALVAVPYGEDYTITQSDLACLSSDYGTELSLDSSDYGVVVVEMVTPLSIAFADVTFTGLDLDEFDQTTYNGQIQKPTGLVATFPQDDMGRSLGESVTLTEGTDYTLRIVSKDAPPTDSMPFGTSAGKNVGEVTIEITGKGAYRGTFPMTYRIDPKEITVTDAAIKDSVYGSYIPEVESVTFDGLVSGETLTPEVDYGAWIFVDPNNPALIEVGNNNVTAVVYFQPTQKVSNYWLRSDQCDATWTITPAPLTGVVSISLQTDADADGTLNEGDILEADVRSIMADNTAILGYQWKRDGAAIDGEISQTYTLTAEDTEDSSITVEITASGNYMGSLTSAPIVVGKKPLLGSISIDYDAGVLTTGDELTLNTDLLDPLDPDAPDATYSIQWYRDGAAISGATNEAYTLTKDDLGKLIMVVVTGTGEYTGTASFGVLILPTDPDAPVLRASAGNEQVTLSWSKPFDGGAPITDYELQYWEGGPNEQPDWEIFISQGSPNFGPSATGFTVTGLTNGTEYSFMLGVRNINSDYMKSDIVTVTPKAKSGSSGDGGDGGGGGIITPPTQTIPAGDGEVAVSFTQKGESVTLSLPTAKINEIIKAAEDGAATFDISDVKDATEAVIPQSALKALSEAGLDMEIKLPEGTVTLDGDALATAVASGGNVTVSLTEVKAETLTEAQKEQINPGDVVFDISLMVGTTVIHELGGTVTVTVPYDGELPVAVWYLNDEGELEKLECTYNEKTGTVTFTTDHLSVYVLGQDTVWVNPFTDVSESAWYFDAVRYVHENGVMQGTGGNLFAPDTKLSRAMMVQILYNLEGCPASGSVSFDDVSGAAWYAGSVAWAYDKGIVNGISNNLFAPDAAVTREQMAVMLYNYMKYKGVAIQAGTAAAFADESIISPWALEAVRAIRAMDIVSGRPGNLYDPQATATRAEVATIFARLAE